MRSTTGWRPPRISSVKSSVIDRARVSLALGDLRERGQDIERRGQTRDPLAGAAAARPAVARSASKSSRSRASIRSAARQHALLVFLERGVT